MSGAASRFRLDELSQQNQGRNGRCCFEVKIDFSVTLERRRKAPGAITATELYTYAAPTPDGDKRKHVEAAINDRLPCAGEEKAARPKDNRCR